MKIKVDLIIVGAGIIGVAHAFWALKKGLSVRLFERDPAPSEATVRNFGQIVPSGLPAGEWQQYGLTAIQTYKEIQREWDISLTENGSTYIASNPEEQGLIEELHQINKASGYESVLWSATQCQENFPAVNPEYCCGALHFPGEVTVEAPVMIHRLLAYLQHKFTKFYYHPDTTIIHCESAYGEVQVTDLSECSWKAERALICTGRDFKHLYAAHFKNSGIKVVKLNMLESAPYEAPIRLRGNILTGLTIRRYEAFQQCPSYHRRDDSIYDEAYFKWGIHILFKRTPQNTLIIGDSHEYATVEHAHELGYDISEYLNGLILKEAGRILNLPHWQMSRTWAGFYTQIKDRPVYDQEVDKSVRVITAIGGKGMSTGLGFAKASVERLYGNIQM